MRDRPRTYDPTTTSLLDHLLRSMLVAEHNAAPIDPHNIVPVLDARCGVRTAHQRAYVAIGTPK